MILLALTVFEWQGLPESIPPCFIEKTLLYEGSCLFFKNKKNPADWCVTRVSTMGKLNMYDMPVSYTAQTHEWTQKVEMSDGVLIRNNYLCTPTFQSLSLFAYRMSNAERSSDVNINSLKTPWILQGSKDQEKTIRALYRKIDENNPAIFGDDSILDINMIKVLKTDSPIVAPELQDYIDRQWNKFMTFIGLENANTQKKERMIVDEVNANNQQTQVSANAMLVTRQEAAKEISKLTGTQVTCDFRVRPSYQDELSNDTETEDAENVTQ
jgi:hypothetical protein